VENYGARSDFRTATVQVDAEGNTYVAGNTTSTDFPLARPFQGVARGTDAYIAKLDANGALQYSLTSVAAAGAWFCVSRGQQRERVLAGRTQSADFPAVSPAQARFGGIEDAFVLKLSPDGSRLMFSTFLGGNDTRFRLRHRARSGGQCLCRRRRGVL